MSLQVWIAGLPSTLGGAETELDHMIDLFHDHEVDVHLVALPPANGSRLRYARASGCTIHDYHDAIFKDRVVLSLCNVSFLAKLPMIIARGRPRRVVWFNCMTRTFPLEEAMHEAGWIDLHGFVSEYQRRRLQPRLDRFGPVRTFPYRPYLNLRRIPWRPRPSTHVYRLGRISRDDPSKFASDSWETFAGVRVPQGQRKKVVVLGFGPRARGKLGPPPPGLDVDVYGPAAIPVRRFYSAVDTLIHKTDTPESYCRVLIEAYAHGVAAIVQDDFAFPELVVHGETGYRTNDSREMTDYATELAFRPDVRDRIVANARDHLEHELNDPSESWRGWQEVLEG